MSTTVDERVVEMRFDNKHFESNVATSMSTLEKLKRSLKFDGATKGLEDINSASKRIDMSNLGNGVESVSAKFSALQVIGVTALANITNSAVNAGKKIVSALTIEPVMSGFQEYETQINAVQTILANTSSKGTTLDQVNAALDELNHYADLTIYNFTEMTRNIGTFTAAGIDLETSVSAIQGIANLAAVSGSTSQQASTAMYQLSQALATGTVKLMDWNSVVNAGMGGEVFQNALKETSRLLGTGADAAIKASGSFRESLSDGWLTAEVLTETLKKFTTSGANEYVAEYTGLSVEAVEAALKNAEAQYGEADAIEQASKALAEKSGKNEEEIKSVLAMAKNAEDAATKVKTFSQLWDTLKEAAQSGWTQTWELIIGDFEEAKAFFTEIHGLFSGIIEGFANSRNELLGGALTSNWDRLIEKVNEAGIETDAFEKKVRECAEAAGIDVNKLVTEYGSLGKAFREGAIDSNFLIEAFNKLTGAVSTTTKKLSVDLDEIKRNLGFGSYGDDVKKVQQALTDLGFSLEKFGVDGIIGPETTAAIKAFQESVGLVADGVVGPKTLAALKEAGTSIEEIGDASAKSGESIDELANSVAKLGGRELLIESLMNTIKSIIDVFKAMGKAWDDTFDPMITSEGLYNALEALHKFTEGLRLFDDETGEFTETGKKLVTTFKGIFAVLDIIKTIVGGGISVAFKALSAILKSFDLNILDVTASIADAVIAFRDWLVEGNVLAKSFDWLIAKLPIVVEKFEAWFAVFKETPAVQKLVDAIEAIQEAFYKLTSGEIDLNEFARALGENLANALKSLPGIAVQIASDFIAGFQNGISDSISGVIGKIVTFCLEFVSAFAEALGVQSPSWKAYETATDFFQGFINGAKDMIGSVLGILKKIGEQIVKVFKSFWDFITDESGNIEWGKIFAGGSIIAMIWVLKQLATAFNGIANALGGIDDLLANAGKVLKSFSKVLDGIAWDLKAQALQKMAIAIGILVASIWVLTTIDDPAKLWNAVGVVAVLAGVLVALSIAMDKLSSASVQINKKGASLDGLKTGLLQIGIAILLIAATAKLIGDMDPDEAKQGFIGLAGIAVGMIAFLAAMSKIAKFDGDISSVGTMMKKLAVAMILMVVACKLVGMLSAEDIGKGILFAGAFTTFVALLTLATKNASSEVSKIGSMAIKLSAAMILLIAVCKLAGTLSTEEMLKGAAFAAAFVIFIGALVAVTKIGNEQKLAKVSGMVLSVSVSLTLLVAVCKLVGKLSVEEMVKGAAFMAAFVILLKYLISILKIGNEEKMASVAGTILAMSVAIGILAGVAVLLSFMDIGGLAKGIVAVGLLSAMMTIMIKALKGANEAKGSIMMMAIAIGVMAASIVALSFIDTQSLASAAGAMTIVMAAFALMIKSMSGLGTAKVAPLIALTGVVLVLAGVIYILQGIDPTSAISSAGSLALLMASMAVVLKILDSMKNASSATKAVLALTAMAIPLLAFSIVLRQMNGIENAMGNVLALTVLMTAMTVLLAAVSLVGKYLSEGIIPGVASLTAMAIPMYVFVLLLKQMDGIEDATGKIESLAIMMTTMTLLLAVLAVVGLGGPAAIIGIGSLVALFAAIGTLAIAIGALIDKFPSIQKFLDTGLPVLEQLAGSIGTMIGKFIGGIGEGLSDSLVKMGEDIAEFMNQLAIASDNASGIKGESFDGVKQLMDVMGDIALTTVGTTISDIFTLGGTSMEKFQKDGVAFFDAMKAIGEASSGINIDAESMNSVISVAQKMADLQSSLEPIGGVMDWFTGRDDLATFGVNAGQFVDSMVTAFSSLNKVDLRPEAMDSVISAATSLAELQSSLEPIGGVISWFSGRDDLGTFGANVGAFISSMVTAFGSLNGVRLNTVAMDSIISAATSLAGLQSSLEPIGGVISWFTGRDDLGTFGANVGAFISSMVTAFGSLVDIKFNTEAMDSIISAATSLAGLQSSLEPIGGVISWFSGRDDLGTFGVNVSAFISSMKTALTTLNGATLNEEALTSVITAAKKLSELQSKLEPMGGVVSWFAGRSDLGTFGTNVGLFADAMGKLKTGMGENGISEEVVASITNASNAIIELHKALPEEGWFDGKMNLSEFSDYITDFATAMSTFGTKAAEIDSGAVSTVISTAYRIKSLIESLVDLDTSGVDAFTGIGSGGVGADGPAYDIARAISKFGNEVKNINTEAVTVATSAAKKLKALIASLVGLDTSGVENFKPGEIGKQMKSYADKVASIDTTIVSSSISSANRLKNFISGLSGLDTSGINNFKPGAIGESLKNYSASISSFNSGAVSSSISSANRLKNFISGLAGLDSSGVSTFKTAINELATVNIAALVTAFSGASTKLSMAGVNMINGLIKGMQSRAANLKSTANTMITSTLQTVKSKDSTFQEAGRLLGNKIATGISSQKKTITSAATACASSAVSAMRGYYNSAYNAGCDLVSGFADGISDDTWRAEARASAMASAAISAARSVLRINSPSKVFKEIGSGVPEGFALGIGMLGGEVKRSVTGMASTAINTTRSAMATVLDALNTDMDTQPTIRPVVDLSDVRTGAAAVSGMFNGIHTVGVRSNLNAINVAMNDKLQNGTNDDVVSAINKLRDGLDDRRGDTYNFGGITYDDGSNISEAVSTLVRAAKMGRRV